MSEIESSSLAQILDGKSGIYQPVYGHEEYDAKVARPCKDRLSEIVKVYDALSKELGRPLRVLDFGCNVGFFSFSLAARGGVVTGIDSHLPNINVCNILASEHPDYKVQFSVDKIEEIIPFIEEGEFDLVLGMSIFHHLCPGFGWTKVRDMITTLSEKVIAGIFELAVREEPMNWAYALPTNYRELIVGFDYIKLLSYNPTPLSNIERPLCYASKKYLYIEELGAMKIDSVTVASQSSSMQNLRKYFYCGNKFIKYFFQRSIEIGHIMAEKEIDFLRTMGGKRGIPKLIGAFKDEEKLFTNYIILMDRLNGDSLLNKLLNNENIDRWNAVKQVLEWLIFLEQQGYYHFDVASINFFCEDNGKITLIDGEWIFNKEDLKELEIYPQNLFNWPRNHVLNFLCIFNEIMMAGSVDWKSGFYRSIQSLTALKKYVSEDQYKQICAIKDSEKVFQRLYEILFESGDATDEKARYTLAERELLAIEDYIEDVGAETKSLKNHFNGIDKEIDVASENFQFIKNSLRTLICRADDVDKKFSGLADYLAETDKTSFTLHAMIEYLAQEVREKSTRLEQVEEIVLAQKHKIEQLEKIIGEKAERND